MLMDLLRWSEGPHAELWMDREPIRSEIFGPDRLDQHARSLAAAQDVSHRPAPVTSIIRRLDDNAAALLAAYREISEAVGRDRPVTPAAEWLLDNFHLAEAHILQIRADLPEGYYKQLPKLASGPLNGHPRIFGLAWAFVAHTDSRFDFDLLTRFTRTYQTIQPLTIGELWAMAISLRLILIENLRRMADRVVVGLRAREAADVLADDIIKLGAADRAVLGETLRANDAKVGSPQFVVQLIHRFRDQDALSEAVMEWLGPLASSLGLSFDSAARDEHQRQAAANVTVRNIITSLRLVSDVNWPDWFESVSHVEAALRRHKTYGEMDFQSRNAYRSAVEILARGSRHSEIEIAELALKDAARDGRDGAEADPGYYLIGDGREAFEAKLAFKPALNLRLAHAIKAAGLSGYLSVISILTIAFAALLAAALYAAGASGLTLIALAAAALIPISDLAIALWNYALARILTPQLLPGLSLRDGVPESCRTLVVIPTLLTSREDVEDLIDRLEVHYLANTGGEIYFGLATDWKDSATERAEGDEALLDAALAGIGRLNARYAGNRFILVHRARLWNPSDDSWMGWERKRGKLHELNRLLRGQADTSYIVIAGRLPQQVRYVITLDADTRLPRDAARRLVGKMAHPLNVARFDERSRRITYGYGIAQPRVTPSLPVGSRGSPFQRIFSSARGIDPYALAISDTYQDMFGEGSFAGKGIYDIDAFEASAAGKIPANTMLSHDLFEGIFARCALVTDVEVIEDYPERLDVHAARQHRWTRGDWQLLPWMLGAHADARPTALGLWKMADNLRRSLSPILLLLLVFAGLIMLPFAASLALCLATGLLLALPPIVPVLAAAVPRRDIVTKSSQLKAFAGDLQQGLALGALQLTWLPYSAQVTADAIIRTLYRLNVSRKHLLEWTTAAQLQKRAAASLPGHYALMWLNPLAALGAAAVAVQAEAPIAFAFSVLWLAGPAVAAWASRPQYLTDEIGDSSDRLVLRLVARRTWRYFEAFVSDEDNRLPPDNFQEEPTPVVAHRTSPTNIGLYLLATASAHDFGWLGRLDAVARLEATMAAMRRLETFRGHLYNWYETRTLVPLEPKYVSSVDSGNLAGHLLALANCCRSWNEEPADPIARLQGIADALDLLCEETERMPHDGRALRSARRQFDSRITAFRRALAKARAEPENLSIRLIELAVQASEINAAVAVLAEHVDKSQADEQQHWGRALQATIESHFRDATADRLTERSIATRLAAIERDARSFALGMEFDFLMNDQRGLLSIGYRVAEGALDESCYDMLASEARLASFFGIAKSDIRTRHWFKLGRTVTAVSGGAALLSWSGSMFEYLMPSLVLRAPSGGLMDQTSRLVVERQIAYGAELGTPWGVSESAFNARDTEFTYQYSNFGVPGLGLKRGLADNAVIAPYATGLAAMVAPRAAAQNFQILAKLGGRGSFGYYEALDFTPARVPKGERRAIVRAYFAHHQGMTIIAILNALQNGVMRARFHSDPVVEAAELLLQERAPREVPIMNVKAGEIHDTNARDAGAPEPRRFSSARSDPPATHLLSNGDYVAMLTAAGSGYSSWKGLSITRWREDSTCDDWGSYIYLRDVRSGETWSAGHMPIGKAGDAYAVAFSEDKAEFLRSDGTITTQVECIVSPEQPAEARRVTIKNAGRRSREIELTTFAELALFWPGADLAHPAFSKLFVHTEFAREQGALIATRRKRSPSEPDIWAAQMLVIEKGAIDKVEFETDRFRFIGRGHDVRMPEAMVSTEPLHGTVGYVLDPVFALRSKLRVPASGQVRCTLWTLAADSREALIDLIDCHRHAAAFDRAAMLCWTQAQIRMRHLGIDESEASLFQSLASHLIYCNGALRPSPDNLRQNMGAQSALWAQGVSGDRPILLVRIDEPDDIDLVRQCLRAFEYLSDKRFVFDLVILNDRQTSYIQDLQVAIENLVRNIRPPAVPNAAGRVYALRADLLSQEALRVLPAVARAVLLARRGNLASQLARAQENAVAEPPIAKAAARGRHLHLVSSDASPPVLEFYNGYGGFDRETLEYVIFPRRGKPLPSPWINVVSNAQLGFHAGAEGSCYTWWGNARETQITAWPNDAVAARPSEAIYVGDEADGSLLSPAYEPMRSGEGTHVARHGFGYTRFERTARNLKLSLTQFVPLDDPVKVSELVLENSSSDVRELTVTFYAEWVLGFSRSLTKPFVTTVLDAKTQAVFARNPWSAHAAGTVVFADLGGAQQGFTCDRREFLGPHGSLDAPEALVANRQLSSSTGGGLDPCVALQTKLKLEPGQSRKVLVVLGAAASEQEAQRLIERYREADTSEILDAVRHHWRETLQTVQVKTPDRSFNIALNGWFLYQAIAARMLARSGFYQTSGAYGFRDQLQDSMAMLHARPDIAREHILRVAGRQFVEGDVQHWWLPATGAGVRTRISDDKGWLAYCVAHYVSVTGDKSVLDEQVPFLEGQSIPESHHDAFFQPQQSEKSATVYEHCALALDCSLETGAHGLPLIGTGDWNDGMNRVGEKGRGESVWLGWFLCAAISAFAPLAKERGDELRPARWKSHAAAFREALEEHGWDGEWYRRGFYDDGAPLGSAQSEECKIDAIAQSWSVLSGAGDPDRAAQAMEAVHGKLIDREHKLALLFTPPFAKSQHDPGYVKAYPPGIRENGGQYSHGSCWSIFAFAKLGQAERAHELFSLMNPINHATTQEEANRYRIEPYVMAGDVYSGHPHAGRGGWSWYTGSAAWMYRAGLEAILGITRKAEELYVEPCLPRAWPGADVSYRFGRTTYVIRLLRDAKKSTPPDGQVASIGPNRWKIALIDSGGAKTIELLLQAHLTDVTVERTFPKSGNLAES